MSVQTMPQTIESPHDAAIAQSVRILAKLKRIRQENQLLLAQIAEMGTELAALKARS
jgi:hypothetical protein